jgi:hypothetical protein
LNFHSRIALRDYSILTHPILFFFQFHMYNHEHSSVRIFLNSRKYSYHFILCSFECNFVTTHIYGLIICFFFDCRLKIFVVAMLFCFLCFVCIRKLIPSNGFFILISLLFHGSGYQSFIQDKNPKFPLRFLIFRSTI